MVKNVGDIMMSEARSQTTSGLTAGNLFRYASIFHTIVASIITFLIIYEPMEVPRIISGAHAGMWFTMGYLMYLIAGPLGSLYFAKLYGNRKSALGLISFILFTLGVVVATWSLMYGGYYAGWMEHVYPASVEGAKPDFAAIHKWLVNFELPAGVGTGAAALGALLGAIGAVFARE